MNCKFRGILRRGEGPTARMFSCCTNPIITEAMKAEEVKIRNPMVCEDCPHKVSISVGTKHNCFGFGDHTEV